MRAIFCAEHDGSVMTRAEYLTAVKNSGETPEQVTTERTTAQVEGPRRPSPCRLSNTAATLKIASFPLGLLLFYIVYNGGKLLPL